MFARFSCSRRRTRLLRLPPRLWRTRGLSKIYSTCIVLYCWWWWWWCLSSFLPFLSMAMHVHRGIADGGGGA